MGMGNAPVIILREGTKRDKGKDAQFNNISAAMAIAGMIRCEGAPAVERYKRFLHAGGSLYPIDALKLAGIDMSSPEPVRSALNEFDALLEKYIAVTGK